MISFSRRFTTFNLLFKVCIIPLSCRDTQIKDITQAQHQPGTTLLQHQTIEIPILSEMPASLPGVRCYTDASTSPDLPSNLSRDVGIGIFIVNNQVHPVQPSTSKLP